MALVLNDEVAPCFFEFKCNDKILTVKAGK